MRRYNLENLEFPRIEAKQIEFLLTSVTEDGIIMKPYVKKETCISQLETAVGSGFFQIDHPNDAYANGASRSRCVVSIWNYEIGGWVSKDGIGDSSFTNELFYHYNRGVMAFKEACKSWGIGRELNTIPMIFIPAEKVALKQDPSGNFYCSDTFECADLAYAADNKEKIVAFAVRRIDAVGNCSNVFLYDIRTEQDKIAESVYRKTINAEKKEQAEQQLQEYLEGDILPTIKPDCGTDEVKAKQVWELTQEETQFVMTHTLKKEVRAACKKQLELLQKVG